MITLATSTFGILLCKGGLLSRSVSGPSGKISFIDEGQGGIPIVFVPSFGGDISHWEDVKERLVRNRRVVRVELRGQGGSDFPKDGDYKISSMAMDIAAVVDSLDLKKFVLVGHSMGGSVVLDYAGANPNRVVGLVMVDANGDPKKLPNEIRNQIKQDLNSEAYEKTAGDYWERLLVGSKPTVKARILSDLKKNPKDMVVRTAAELLDYDPNSSLKRYKGPKLAIVTPNNDDPYSLHRLQGGFPFSVIQDAGHWFQLDKPDEFYEILKSFLDKL